MEADNTNTASGPLSG